MESQMRRGALVLTASALLWMSTLGCSTPTDSCPAVDPVPPEVGLGAEPVFPEGHPVVLDVQLPSPPRGCKPAVVESSRVEVTNSLSEKIDAASRIVPGPPTIARVTFSPPAVGDYHVRVIFEPNLGTVQQDVLVVRDAEAQPVLTLSQACSSVMALANGAFLCAGDNVLVRRSGETVALDPAAKYAVSNDVLWEYGARSIRRLVDSGAGAPALTAELTGVFSTPRLLSASDTDLLSIGNGLERVRFDGVKLLPAGSASVPPEGGRFLVRSGNVLFVDEGEGITETYIQGFTLDDAGTIATIGGVEQFSYLLKGADANGVWMWPTVASGRDFGPAPIGPGAALTYFTVVDQALTSTLSVHLPPGFGIAVPEDFGGRPALGAAQNTGNQPLLLPSYDGAGVTWDLLSFRADDVVFGTTPGRFAWVRDDANGSGTTVLQVGP